MAIKLRLLFIYIIFIITEGILCLYITYVEEHSGGRLPCKHDIPDDEVHRVKWFKSIRDDIYEDGNPVLVSRDGASQPYTTNNYGIDKEFSLVIYITSIRDRGIYRCYVTRNNYAHLFPFDIKLVSYGKVKPAHTSAAQYATSLRLPCSHNLTTTTVVSALWYKIHSTDSFKNDDQPIASRTDSGSHVLGKYTFNDDFSLEIQNVSFENEAVYRCIVVSLGETKPSASDTNVTVYALPREVPLIQHFIQDNAFFINCSVDHVYPLLYPELKFINNRKNSKIRNEDGTYNTCIRGKLPDMILNATVECSFPYFNYKGKSSYDIPFNFSVEDEAPHPKDCSASICRNQTPFTVEKGFEILLLIPSLLIFAVFVWKRHTKQHKQKDVEKTTPEIEPMV